MTALFRQAVNAEIETWRVANHPTIFAAYENGPTPDEATVGPIWIDCDIRWYSARLASMGVRPLGRHAGTILTNVYFRDAEGTGPVDAMLDEIKELLRARRLGGAVLSMPARTISTDFHGWYKSGLLTPFTLDDA